MRKESARLKIGNVLIGMKSLTHQSRILSMRLPIVHEKTSMNVIGEIIFFLRKKIIARIAQSDIKIMRTWGTGNENETQVLKAFVMNGKFVHRLRSYAIYLLIGSKTIRIKLIIIILFGYFIREKLLKTKKTFFVYGNDLENLDFDQEFCLFILKCVHFLSKKGLFVFLEPKFDNFLFSAYSICDVIYFFYSIKMFFSQKSKLQLKKKIQKFNVRIFSLGIVCFLIAGFTFMLVESIVSPVLTYASWTSNDDYVDDSFWAGNPSDSDIISAFFGDGQLGTDSTAYSQRWSGALCDTSLMTVEHISSLAGPFNSGTIYILDQGTYTVFTRIILDSCSALVSTGGVTLVQDSSLNDVILSMDGVNNVVVDGINFDGGGFPSTYVLSLDNSVNITFHAIDMSNSSATALA
ncbi:MAG TPA: hypothetical protein PKD96_00100, partial [Candidatus Absconditabacterales bacterium]|nr:hypothetical protein [Candidatus Absconditabacterales bacterium]